MSVRISDVLRHKGSHVVTVPTGALVKDLVEILAENNIGAIVVLNGEQVAGIVSERDIVRRLYRQGMRILDTPVSAIMSTPVVTCSPEDTVEDLMSIMTEHRFRHLPVIQAGRLIGIVSIGDVVKNVVAQLESDREHLERYILHG